MSKVIGIDLGTTNSCIAMANEIYGGGVQATPIQAIQLDGNKGPIQSNMLPSNLYVDETGREYVGLIAKSLREQSPNRVISNSKRYIGTDTIMRAGGKSYKAKDIARLILATAKKSIERYGFNNEEDSVTITVPSSFSTHQIKDTIDAAKEASFKNITIIPEPIAAVLDFINSQKSIKEVQRVADFSKKKRILVFDLGGGTCDIEVIEVLQDSKKIDFVEIATGRYDELGGVDFDLIVAKYLLKEFCSKRKVNFENLQNEDKRHMINGLRVFAEKAKEFISGNLELGFDEDMPYGQYIMNFYHGEDIYFEISRSEYDKATENLYKKADQIKCYEDLIKNKNIVDPIMNTLRDYKISKDSIDLIFLTGGMTKYKTIKEKVMEIMDITEEKIITSPYPLESVARGAAIYQYYDITVKNENHRIINDSGDNKGSDIETTPINTKVVLTKVMASAVMVDVSEGLPITLIETNQKVPCSGVISGKLRTTSPAGIAINMYYGKDATDWQMKLQKSKKAMFKNPIKVGTPIDIYFNIDDNKYLTMSIKVEDEEIKIEDDVEVV